MRKVSLYAFSCVYVFVDILKTPQYEIVMNKNPAVEALKKKKKQANKISNKTKPKQIQCRSISSFNLTNILNKV